VPLAFVEGRVLDDEGVGVSGLPVFLRAIAGGAVRESIETRADGTGHYVFERVPDGDYLLEFGFCDASLVPALELDVVAPSLHLPVQRVPRLYELELDVLERDAGPLEGAHVRGWCSGGGRIDCTSDALGVARQPWIPAGRVTVSVSCESRPDLSPFQAHLDFPPQEGRRLEVRLGR